MIIKGQTKVENYIDFQDVEPKNPVKGQKYYDGEKVVTWNGSEWQTVVNPTQLEKDVASAVQAGESAGEKADEAKLESSKAVESANSAVNKANGAAEDAGFAKNTANEAKGIAYKATDQANEAKSNASQAIEDAANSLKKSDSNEKTIIDVSKNVDTVKGELGSKVNQTDYDTLKGTVSDQSTSIEQNTKDIKLKANSQDVDTINQTVKSHGTEISQNAKAIKTKAEQSNVDNVSGEVETLSTTVEQQAGRIETVSSKTDGNTTAIGKIESSYDGLKSTVSEVKDDVETAGGKLSTLEQNLNGFKTTVQNEKADKTTVTQLADQWQQTTDLVDGHTSQISSLGDNVNLRVEKDDVINQINVSDEKILIDGGKTHITGKTTIDEGVIDTAHIKNAAITSAKIKSITAGKIEAGTVKGLVLSSESATGKFSVEGQHAIFENTDTSERTELSDSGLLVYDRNGNMKSQITRRMVNSSYFGTSNVNTYVTVGSIDKGDDEAEEGSGEFRVVDYDPKMSDGTMKDGRDDYTYLNMRANALFANVIRVNYAARDDGVVNNNLYLQPRYGYEIRLTAPGTTAGNSVYQNLRAKDLYANVLQSNSADGDNHVYIRPINSGELRVTAPGTTNIFRNIRANDAYIRNIVKPVEGDLYFGASGSFNFQGRGLWDDGNWRPINAARFNNQSLASLKTNITPYNKKAIDVINFADIYNYNLKSDLDEGKQKVSTGLVIGEGYNTPECVQNEEETGIDIYAMATVAWKAIQELSQQNEDLKSEIDIIRKEVHDE